MKNQDWALLNAATLQKKYPSRYIRPTNRQLLGMLINGSVVQLILKVNRKAPRRSIGIEFIWAEVLGFQGGIYYGTLVNQSGIVKELAASTKIKFIPDHVLLCKEKPAPIALEMRKGA